MKPFNSKQKPNEGRNYEELFNYTIKSFIDCPWTNEATAYLMVRTLITLDSYEAYCNLCSNQSIIEEEKQ